jgi:DNA-binding SARP family transcriptional activator
VAAQLEIASHVVTAILATWLGVTVLARARTSHASRVFAWVTLLLVIWSAAIVVERLTVPGGTGGPFNAVEGVAAFLLPAATLHIVLAFTAEAGPSGLQRACLLAAYLLGAATGLQAIADPGRPIAVDPPNLALGPIGGATLGWLFIVARVAIFGLAIWWSYRAWAGSAGDRARRGQTGAALLTVATAAIGGVMRLLPADLGGPKWVGVSLVTVAVLFATYAVLAQSVFLTPHAARRAFRSSFLTGALVTVYAAAVIGAEALIRRELGLGLPIFTALVIAATIALIEPIREWLGGVLDASGGGHAYRRLVRALDPRSLVPQPPEGAVQPLLERVIRVMGLSGARVETAAGEPIAQQGAIPGGEGALAIAIGDAGRTLGVAHFGAKQSGQGLSEAERALLRDVALYIGASLELGAHQAQQASELTALGSQRADVEQLGSRLDRALASATRPIPRLRVLALGPLRVERGGATIRQWGGPKAGTRQAEAVFAFLFDRGERGVAKDEFLEVIWPDVDLDRADAAFHRTLVGLRGLLEPSRAPRDQSEAIRFHNDRYHLDPGLVEWSDVEAFTERCARAAAAEAPTVALVELEAARALYRGDLLDDCPFYGDSAYVEERRGLLRGRYIDLLVAIGERYEELADRAAAAAAYREALTASGAECPPAAAGLDRLGARP